MLVSIQGQSRGLEKELEESNSDYRGTAAWKHQFDCSDNKRIHKFVCAIQLMIDNDPSKSIRSIAKDMSVQVSYQASGALRHLVFLIQDEKWPVFNSRGKVLSQRFWTSSIISSKWTCFVISQMWKISARIREWTHRKTVELALSSQDVSIINENQIPSTPHSVWGDH